MSHRWADIMDDEDRNVSVCPKLSIKRRPSIRPRRTQSDGNLYGKSSSGTGTNDDQDSKRDNDTQNLHKSTSD